MPWRQRVENMERNWTPLLPMVIDAFLAWRHPRAEAAPVDIDPDYSFDIDVIDIYGLIPSTTITRSSDESAAVALVRHGYLGNSLVNPSLAISLKTLELLRCLKLVKASFSAEAFAKLICYQYYIPYRPLYWKAIADAFDVYLTICHSTSDRVMKALGRDGPDWRPRNACPACTYKLEDEEPEMFTRLICMDGNNSLKRMAPPGKRSTGDTRLFQSDYILPCEFVDRYANEVKARQQQPRTDLLEHTEGEGSEDDCEDGPDSDGDPTDGATGVPSPCASHWKAASADDKKRMWGVFEETGIFACACRHGLILWVVDMVRSGELPILYSEDLVRTPYLYSELRTSTPNSVQSEIEDNVREDPVSSGRIVLTALTSAKYPLAIVAKALDVLGERLMIGYDIGCEFLKTVNSSSLAPAARELELRFCVNAFHSYSHSYNCQVAFHPMTIAGMGLEDLEVMERIFSSSNQLAPIVRYASRYRRSSLIDVFFRQWDDEKYANLGIMLFNNLVQALDIVREQGPVLEQALQSLQLSHKDLEGFSVEERQYFLELRDEQDSNLHAVAYMEALQEFRSVSEELSSASRRFNAKAPETPQLQWADPRTGATDYDADLSSTRKLETQRRYLRDRLKQLTKEVANMEAAMNIDVRWQPEDVAYRETLQYMATRKYQQALGKLQRLVILRLFELHKMNLAQTGYHMRTYIAKNLQRRCKAIWNAVNSYNAAAAALDPPREALDWTKVSHYTFLEEFTLLQDTGNKLLEKRWAQPHVRETMRIARRIARAQEEIRNVNREARRLHTHIRDEEALLTRVLTDLKGRADPLYGAVLEYSRHRRSANARNLAYLSRMYALDGFSGNPTPGVRANTPSDGSAPPSDTGDPMHAGSALSALVTAENDELAREDGDIAAVVENDQVHEEVTGILEFLASLVLGGDVAAIYDQLRPANMATGKYLPVLPIVVCCWNLNNAEAIFRLNGELFLKADPNDMYTLLQYVMWDEGPLASVWLETPGPYYAIRFGVETGIWIGFTWDSISYNVSDKKYDPVWQKFDTLPDAITFMLHKPKTNIPLQACGARNMPRDTDTAVLPSKQPERPAAIKREQSLRVDPQLLPARTTHPRSTSPSKKRVALVVPQPSTALSSPYQSSSAKNPSRTSTPVSVLRRSAPMYDVSDGEDSEGERLGGAAGSASASCNVDEHKEDSVLSKLPLTCLPGALSPSSASRVSTVNVHRSASAFHGVNAREEKKEKLTNALMEARAAMWEFAVNMHEEFPGHSAKYYYNAIMQRARLRENPARSRPGMRSQELKKHNEADKLAPALGEDERKRVSSEIIKELAARWRNMNADERAAAVGDGVEKLTERRENHKEGVHNIAINAFNDLRVNLASISKELENLNARTSADVLLIVVRSDPDQYNAPYIMYTNDRIPQFITSMSPKKETIKCFAMRLEAACIGGIDEQACVRGEIGRMSYVNFDDHITLPHGIVIEGWPHGIKFAAPGKFNSIPELQALYAAWETGAARFRTLTNAEWREWVAAYCKQNNPKTTTSDPENSNDDYGDECSPLRSPEPRESVAPSPLLSSSTAVPPPSSAPLPSSAPPPSSAPLPSPAPSTPPDAIASMSNANTNSTASMPAPAPSLPEATSTTGEVPQLAGRKRARDTLQVQFLNAVSNADGTGIVIPKRPRKERSDKNMKKGPRKKRKGNENNTATSHTPDET
ncbi:LOW QUALITY PROTEIN: hypothetical protein ACG7TL_002532 [Trametes sanguinea]